MTSPDWTRHYQPGVPAEIELPTQPLSTLLERAVAADPDNIATDFFGATMTYGEIADQVSRAAEGLRARGVQAGDRVAIMLPNCPQHVIAFYAVLRLGAIVVEHNPLYTPRELGQMFDDHGARVAIVWDAVASKVPDGLETVIAVNMLDAFPTSKRLALRLPLKKTREARAKLTKDAPGTTPWARLVSGVRLSPSHPLPDVMDTAVIQYTSGTTGAFKGAMLSHFNLYSNALEGAAWMRDAVDGHENTYVILPMFHAFGMTLYLTHGIMRRTRLVLFPAFDVDMVLDRAKKVPPTVFCAVPPIYKRTAERAAERNIPLTSARFCISGGLALTDEIVDQWEKATGGLLVEGYGLTETSPVALGNPFWAPTRKTGTIGIPFPSTLRKVVDPDDPTHEVGVGEPGELLLKGPQVFSGYWNDPESTKKAFTEDGWLRTGDLVTLDEDGFATIVDRLKELIITGGFNVSPSEVEAVLREHPDIENVSVVGLPYEGGERVVAAVTTKSGQPLDTPAARTWAKERLTPYKVPREFVTVDALPTSLLGKVMRKDVRTMLMERAAQA